MSSSSSSAAASSVSSQLTCNICKTTFENNTVQRAHAKSEWHIYNLKRHLTSLPPISYQVYNERVANVNDAPASKDLDVDDFHHTCTACKKDFYKSKAYLNHLKSAAHAQAIAKEECENHSEDQEDEEEESYSSEMDEDFSLQGEEMSSLECLFCPYSSSSLSRNLTHMHTTHNFLVPHQASLIDLPTFLNYLTTLITTFHECLYCGQSRDTTSSIRQHMLDKGHCRLPEDVLLSDEFGEFWESEDEEDTGRGNERGKVEGEENGKMDVRFDPDTKELHLLSGRTLGHRSHAATFRKHHHHKPSSTLTSPQEFKAIEHDGTNSSDPDPTHHSSITSETAPTSNLANTTISPQTNPSTRRTAMALSRISHSNKGLIGLSEAEKRAVRAQEKKMVKMEVRARNLYAARVERGANRQKWFKPDVPGPKNG